MDTSRQPLLLAALWSAVVGLGPAACGDDSLGSDTEGHGSKGDASTSASGGDSESDSDSATSGASDSDSDGETDGETPLVPAEGGIRRLTRPQLLASLELLLGPQSAAAADQEGLPTDSPLHDFDAIGNAELALSSAGVQDYERAITAAATAVLDDPDVLATHVPCVVDGPQNAGCYRAIAEELGHIAWRRPLTDEEVDRTRMIAEAAREWDEGDFLTGVKYELMALLQSPDFLYMVEVGDDDAYYPERRRLTGGELATRMSFFILGRNPDRALLELAEDGGLETEDDIRDTANAMLNDVAARSAMATYYDEFLHLRDLPTIGKNPALYPEFGDALTSSMRESVLRTIETIVWELDADARDIFRVDYTFVDKLLAEHYGVDKEGGGWSLVTLPPEHERAGFLGSAAFLARFAHAEDTSPTRRGNFILGKFLCEEVPPPPPEVNPNLPEPDPDNPQTMKQRLEQHMEDPSCATCHGQMDPIGFALEHFDAVGRFRTEDRNGLMIDSFGEVDGLGSFRSPLEIAQALEDDRRVPGCFVKNFARASMGHMETTGEEASLRDVEAAFVETGFSTRELIVELVANPVFRYVTPPEA